MFVNCYFFNILFCHSSDGPDLVSILGDLQISKEGKTSYLATDQIDEFTRHLKIEGKEVQDNSGNIYGHIVYIPGDAPEAGFYFCKVNSKTSKKLLDREEEFRRLTEQLAALENKPRITWPTGHTGQDRQWRELSLSE